MDMQSFFLSKYMYNNGHLISKFTGRPIKNCSAGGYLKCTLMVDGKERHFKVARIIYCMHYGIMPDVVDHINRDVSDNRIENLRAATLQQNSYNRGVSTRNKLGVKGVCLNGSNNKKTKPYAAYIKRDGKSYRIGSFTTIEEAKAAYDAVASTHFGEYAAR